MWRFWAQLFQDRLEAVEVMLLQKPIVSGRYTAYAFHHFVLPLDPHFRAVWQRCAPACPARCNVFCRDPSCDFARAWESQC